MPEPLLQVNAIDAFYGDFQALFGVSLSVEAGQVVAVIGANGAGKSTLLKSIAGLMPPRRGEIVFDGQNIAGTPAFDVVKRGIALVPEGRRLFPSLSVEENLLIGGQAKRPGPWSLRRVYALFPVLAERRHLPATSLSGGQQQMCAIGRALMSSPRILLLDEPSAGLAPLVVAQVFELVKRIRDEGLTVLIVEQNVAQVLRLVDRAYVLDAGRVVAEGAAAALAADPAIRNSYLGGH